MPATTAEIAGCTEAGRGLWLLKGFYHSQSAFGAVLIIYLMQAYKAAPSKARALYIYDKCIYSADEGLAGSHQPGQTTALPLDLHCLKEGIVLGGKVEGTISLIREARIEAMGRSWLSRITSSGDRKVNDIGLGAHVFDDILTAHLDARTPRGNHWQDILKNIATLAAPVAMSIYPSMKRGLPPTIAEIEAAGFDLNKLGIGFLKKALNIR